MSDDLFILGTGFSSAVSSGKIQTLAQLSKELSPEIDKLFLGNEIPPDKLKGNKGKDITGNIEHLLSYLAVEQPWLGKAQTMRNKAAFLDLSKMIAERISAKQEDAITDGFPHWFLGLVQKWHECKANVITLNYDLLVEVAATNIDASAVNHNDRPSKVTQDDLLPVSLTNVLLRMAGLYGGDDHHTLQLYKLHGSLNWYYSGKFEFHGETIYTVPVHKGKFEIRNDHETAVKDKVPLVIPPTLDKTSFFNNETIRNIWSSAGSAFKKAKRVFCLGYSFPETDMMIRHFVLTNANPDGAKFYWVNLTGDDSRLKNLLPEHYTVDSSDWGNDPIKNFAETYAQGKEGELQVIAECVEVLKV